MMVTIVVFTNKCHYDHDYDDDGDYDYMPIGT